MRELSKKVGDMTYDGLVTDTKPEVIVSGGTIAKGAADTTYVRGTLLGKTSAGKLAIFGTEGATADCILCDEVTVGTAEDVTVPVYIAGCFDPEKLVMADGAALTEAVKDTLRTKGIIFKAASAAV